ECSDAREAAVPLTLHGSSVARKVVRGILANIRIGTDALHTESLHRKALIDVHIDVVGASRIAVGSLCQAGCEAGVSIDAAQQCDRIPRVAVRIVPGKFESQLVVANATETIAIPLRQEVVVKPRAANTRQRQETLFREKIIEFEFPNLYIQPRGVQQVV